MSYGEKLSEISSEYAQRYLFESSLLARTAKRQEKKEWYDKNFIPYIQEKTRAYIQENFGNIKELLNLLEGRNNQKMKQQIWTNINDWFRLSLVEEKEIMNFLKIDNTDIDSLLEHAPTNGLNRIIKKLVNCCLVLEKNTKKNNKEEISIKKERKKVHNQIRSGLSIKELEKILQKYGFSFDRFSNGVHKRFMNERGDIIQFPIHLPNSGITKAYASEIRNMVLHSLGHDDISIYRHANKG